MNPFAIPAFGTMRAALTSRSGTESWYLARSLRRYGLETRFKVQPRESASFPAPSIAGVVFPGGAGHFVAVLKDTNSEVTIADPLVGKLVINKADLRKRYHFTGFFLAVRRPATS